MKKINRKQEKERFNNFLNKLNKCYGKDKMELVDFKKNEQQLEIEELGKFEESTNGVFLMSSYKRGNK